MTILTREQIDALRSNYADEISQPQYNGLLDTARAYHDLRDAVLAVDPLLWPDPPNRYDSMEATRAFADGSMAQRHAFRDVVARVEGGE